jgi:antitoxin CcdA
MSMAFLRMADAPKRATNVSLNQEKLALAKKLKVNISQSAEHGLDLAIKEKLAKQWLHENKAALDSSNEYVEKHGLPLAKYRQF